MKKVLMVSPDFFDIEYAINAYMTSASGVLNKIDAPLAKKQWENLKNVYFELGFDVQVIGGIKGLPDMVFSANQSFTYWDRSKKKPAVVMSNMRSSFRKNEVQYFEKFYLENGYHVSHLDAQYSFEGNGDALLRPNTNEVYGGYGFRTDKNVYHHLQAKTGCEIFTLELKNEYFYHLDTCLSILNEDAIAFVPQAFTSEGLNLLDKKFKTKIEIDLDEAKNNFAGNCHCPDGKNVILQKGSTLLNQKLISQKFQVIEVDTSEYIKSGGSVFCMKMMCY
jgi:N-dimethylarginine dimethylaminohydrolase